MLMGLATRRLPPLVPLGLARSIADRGLPFPIGERAAAWGARSLRTCDLGNIRRHATWFRSGLSTHGGGIPPPPSRFRATYRPTDLPTSRAARDPPPSILTNKDLRLARRGAELKVAVFRGGDPPHPPGGSHVPASNRGELLFLKRDRNFETM